MIKRTLGTLVAAAALYLTAGLTVGCGGAVTDLQICNANCDNDKKCGRKNDVETANCHTDCNSKAGLHAQADQDLAANCSNSNEIRQQELNCLSNTDACTSLQPGICQLTALNNCIKK